MHAVGREALELETAAGAEIIVGDELVRKVRWLLLLRPRERLRANDVVLLLDLALLEHDVEQQGLEIVRQRLGLFV